MYMDFEIPPEEKHKVDRGAYTFYGLMDAVQIAAKFLEKHTAECRIVDVIYAVREANGV